MSMTPELTPMLSRLAQAGTPQQPFETESLSIRELESFTAIRLRALPGSDLTAFGLPSETGACIGNDPAILCLRPNEWLSLGFEGGIEKPPGLFAWDQADGLGILRIQGEAAPWLLRKNAALDFNVDSSTPDHCARCKFGRTSVLIHFHRDSNGSGLFDLVVDRSLVKYLWTLLLATAPHAMELAREYQALRGRAQS